MPMLSVLVSVYEVLARTVPLSLSLLAYRLVLSRRRVCKLQVLWPTPELRSANSTPSFHDAPTGHQYRRAVNVMLVQPILVRFAFLERVHGCRRRRSGSLTTWLNTRASGTSANPQALVSLRNRRTQTRLVHYCQLPCFRRFSFIDLPDLD